MAGGEAPVIHTWSRGLLQGIYHGSAMHAACVQPAPRPTCFPQCPHLRTARAPGGMCLMPSLHCAAKHPKLSYTSRPAPRPAPRPVRQIPDMSRRRGAHACTPGPGGLLYVVGGYDVTQEDAFMFSGGKCRGTSPAPLWASAGRPLAWGPGSRAGPGERGIKSCSGGAAPCVQCWLWPSRHVAAHPLLPQGPVCLHPGHAAMLGLLSGCLDPECSTLEGSSWTWPTSPRCRSLPLPPSSTAVEAFDPRAGKWMPRARMAQGRAYGVAAYADDSLWAVGGMSGEQCNEYFERWVISLFWDSFRGDAHQE